MFTLDGFNIASDHYEKALKIDPYYALAYVGLAEVISFRTFWGNVKPEEGLTKANFLINNALSINNKLAEAYAMLGNINTFYYWNWKEADHNFKKALKINPNSSMILIDYAIFLSLTGFVEEAINIAKRAKEFDPLSWYINSRTGDVFAAADQYDKAIEQYKMSIAINPNYFLTHLQLGLSYAKKKQVKEVIPEFEKAAYLSNGNPFVLACLVTIYNRIWKKSKANKLFAILKKKSETEYVPPTCFFIIYFSIGDEVKATEWLRIACLEHDTLLPHTRNNLLKNSETGLKYINLLKEMGLDY